jgi:hypothetical protein
MSIVYQLKFNNPIPLLIFFMRYFVGTFTPEDLLRSNTPLEGETNKGEVNATSF